MRGSKSIENMRAALVDLLSKGGQQFRQFDDRYAEAFRDRVMVPAESGPLAKPRNILGALGGGGITYGPAPVLLDNGRERVPHTLQEKLVGYAFPTAAATIRYGIPVAGVTTAGTTLMDLIAAMGKEDQEI